MIFFYQIDIPRSYIPNVGSFGKVSLVRASGVVVVTVDGVPEEPLESLTEIAMEFPVVCNS